MRRNATHRWAATGLVALSLLANGCATIIHGTKQDISIATQPTGASIAIDGEARGKSPMVANLQRRHDHTVHIELAGYLPYDMKLNHTLSGWLFGNIIFGGLIGFIVDPADGAMYKLTPAQVNAVMQASAATPAPLASAPGTPTAARLVTGKGDTIYVAISLQPDPAWERIGTLQRQPATPAVN